MRAAPVIAVTAGAAGIALAVYLISRAIESSEASKAAASKAAGGSPRCNKAGDMSKIAGAALQVGTAGAGAGTVAAPGVGTVVGGVLGATAGIALAAQDPCVRETLSEIGETVKEGAKEAGRRIDKAREDWLANPAAVTVGLIVFAPIAWPVVIGSVIDNAVNDKPSATATYDTSGAALDKAGEDVIQVCAAWANYLELPKGQQLPWSAPPLPNMAAFPAILQLTGGNAAGHTYGTKAQQTYGARRGPGVRRPKLAEARAARLWRTGRSSGYRGPPPPGFRWKWFNHPNIRAAGVAHPAERYLARPDGAIE